MWSKLGSTYKIVGGRADIEKIWKLLLEKLSFKGKIVSKILRSKKEVNEEKGGKV